MLRYFSAILLLITLNSSYAQNSNVGTWGIGTIVLPGDSSHRWGGYTELQLRSNDVLNNFMYYEVKAGISYDIDKNFTALLGSGRYTTYDYHNLSDGPTITETRFWEQLTSNQFLATLNWNTGIGPSNAG